VIGGRCPFPDGRRSPAADRFQSSTVYRLPSAVWRLASAVCRLRSALIFAVLLALLLAVGSASAHASLLQSLPAANAQLQTAPAQVELFFSEPVEASFSTIKVLDSQGARVDDGVTRLDPQDGTHLLGNLRSLPDGIYTVAWQVLSSVDGHVTQGAFPFAVGQVDPATLTAAGQAVEQAGLSAWEAADRWITLLAIMIAVGGLVFVPGVWLPIFSGKKGGDAHWLMFHRLRQIGVTAVLAASLFNLFLQASRASGGNPLSVIQTGALGQILFDTRFGLIWLGRVAAALLLGAYGTDWPRWTKPVPYLAALGLLLSVTLNSHAAAAPEPFLPVLSDLVHIIAASVWIGGLAYFGSGLRAIRDLPAKERRALTAALIPRFSVVGVLAVGLIVLTGTFNAWVGVGSWRALLDTPYGRALLVKLAIIVPLLALAGINLLVIRPRMRSKGQQVSGTGKGAESGLLRLFGGTVTGELALGLGVVLMAAVLSSTPPARTLASAPGLSFKEQADDLSLSLVISPGTVGLNQFKLEVQGTGTASEVLLRFSPLSGDFLPPSDLALDRQPDDSFTASGANLAFEADWQVQAVVRRPDEFDAFANFNVTVALPGRVVSPRPSALPLSRYAAGLLFAMGLLAVLLVNRLPGAGGRVRQAFGLGIALALGAVAGRVYTRVNPLEAAQAGLVNPIPPSAESISRGSALYQPNCAACHGEGGRGDGPAGVALNPPPADLAIHTQPGVHTDGQLFTWIADGFPGSAMPAWRGELSDDEIWDLVNFIRMFGERGGPPIPTPRPLPTAPPVITPDPGTAVPDWPFAGENLSGQIFYTQGVDGLWSLDPATGLQTQLWKLPERGYLADAALSPDGRTFALAYSPPPEQDSPQLGASDIYLMDAGCISPPEGCPATLQPLLVRANPRDVYFSIEWSPDGNWLYYANYKTNEQSYEIILGRTSATGDQTAVIARNAFQPGISPDGTMLAYVAFGETSLAERSLWMADADGANPRRLLAAERFVDVAQPVFSPDGAYVVFAASGELDVTSLNWFDRLTGVRSAEAHGLTWDLWRVPVSGGEPERLTELYEDGPWPAFSPDGRHLAFLASAGIYLGSADGSDVTFAAPAVGHGSLQWALSPEIP